MLDICAFFFLAFAACVYGSNPFLHLLKTKSTADQTKLRVIDRLGLYLIHENAKKIDKARNGCKDANNVIHVQGCIARVASVF